MQLFKDLKSGASFGDVNCLHDLLGKIEYGCAKLDSDSFRQFLMKGPDYINNLPLTSLEFGSYEVLFFTCSLCFYFFLSSSGTCC